ncbi:MAG: lipopolysaccharide heptosyltransferase II [Candidatus Woesearchaeota archaeon]
MSLLNRTVGIIGNMMFIFKKRKIKEGFDPEKILLIRSASIGDVMMTTPAIKALAEKYPKSKIDYLVGNYSRKVLEGNNHIDEIIGFDEEIIRKPKIGGIIKLIKELRGKKYDLCIVFDKSWLWGLFAYFCRVKYRIGFDRKGEGFAHNLSVKFKGEEYELDYNNSLLGLLKIGNISKQMEISISPEENNEADEIVRKAKTKRTLIGIAPGGAKNPGQEMDSKRLPKPKYAKICNKLIEKNNIIFFGSKEDSDIINDIMKLMKKKPTDLSGKLSLKVSAAVIGKCDLFISHDTGLMHIAAAMKIPQIAIFGPTPPKRFSPEKAKVVAAGQKKRLCYDMYGRYNKDCSCIQEINVEDVIGEAERILGK